MIPTTIKMLMRIVCMPDPVVSLAGSMEGSSLLLLTQPTVTKDWRRYTSRIPSWIPDRLVTSSSIYCQPTVSNIPKYSCRICGKEFTRKHSVKVHQRDSHFTTPDTVFSCRYCNKTATTQKALKMHIHRYHHP